MIAHPQNNAVTQRLQQLQELYRQAFPVTRETGLCLWAVKPDEVDMIAAFVLTEDSPGAVFKDLFLTFVGADAGAMRYPKELGVEWQTQLMVAAEALTDQGLSPTLWETEPRITSLRDFFTYVLKATRSMKNLGGRTVIYLRPETYADENALATALATELQAGLPTGLILMLHAAEDSTIYQRLAGRTDWGVTTLEANLKMDTVSAELAAAGAPNDPAVQYRSRFLEMSELGGRGAYDKMKEIGEELEALTRQQAGWEHLVVTVLAAQGSHLLTAKARRREAQSFFQRGREAAEIAVATANPAGRAVMLQSLGFEGAGLVHLKDYAAAARVYAELSRFAAEDEADTYHRMEASRMAAWCYERDGEPARAWEYYQEGLSAASSLSPNVLRGSTFPYLGRDFLRLIDQLNRHGETRDIRETMTRLVGPDWEELLEKAEKAVAA